MENNKQYTKEEILIDFLLPENLYNTFTNFDNNPKWGYLTREQIIEKYGDRLTEEELEKLKKQ